MLASRLLGDQRRYIPRFRVPRTTSRATVLGVLALLGLELGFAASANSAGSRAPQCSAEPRSYAEVAQLLDADPSEPKSPAFAETPPGESPIHRSTLRAVVLEFIACSGAGEPLRVWSLYTDDYLARLLARERGYDRARYASDAEPRPIPTADWPTLRKLSEPWLDDRGWSVVEATIWYPNLDREKRLRISVVWVDGAPRIAEIDGEITFSVP